jgi:hypothetical protein
MCEHESDLALQIRALREIGCTKRSKADVVTPLSLTRPYSATGKPQGHRDYTTIRQRRGVERKRRPVQHLRIEADTPGGFRLSRDLIAASGIARIDISINRTVSMLMYGPLMFRPLW